MKTMTHKYISLATANPVLVDANGRTLNKIVFSNDSASPRYLHVYDSAIAPTPGVGTPIQAYEIPGNASGILGALSFDTMPLPFASGIAYTITALKADGDSTVIGAGDVIVNMIYQVP